MRAHRWDIQSYLRHLWRSNQAWERFIKIVSGDFVKSNAIKIWSTVLIKQWPKSERGKSTNPLITNKRVRFPTIQWKNVSIEIFQLKYGFLVQRFVKSVVGETEAHFPWLTALWNTGKCFWVAPPPSLLSRNTLKCCLWQKSANNNDVVQAVNTEKWFWSDFNVSWIMVLMLKEKLV